MTRETHLLLVVFALVGHCSSTAIATDLQQLTAIWQFSGATFPLPDEQVYDVISKVVNPLTNVPWGNPVQSGGYNYLCKVKLGIDCSQQYTPGGTTEGVQGSPASSPSQPPSEDPHPSVSIGIAPAPAAADVATAAGSPDSPSEAPAPAATAGMRRRLQAKDNVYLKLDTTEGVPGMWTTQSVDAMVATLESLISSGEFQTALDASTTLEGRASLRHISLSSVPGPPSAEEPPTQNPTPDASPAAPSPASTAAPLPDFLPFPPMESGGAPKAATPPDDDNASTSGSNKTVLIVVLCCVVGGLVVAVAGVAFFLHRRRRVRARADAELMVHRWSRDREVASFQRAKLGGGTYRSSMDVAHSVQSARSMGSKELDIQDFRSFRSPSTRAQRSDLGLSRGANAPLDLQVEAAPRAGHPPPPPKKGLFDFLYW